MKRKYKDHIKSLFHENEVHKIFGPAGTGKTTYLINELKKIFQAGIEPERIAFVSFTNRAVDELVMRCSQEFNHLDKEAFKFFRTIHSLCYRMGGNEEMQIIKQTDLCALGKKNGFEISTFRNLEDGFGIKQGDKVVNVESLARLRMTSLEEQWRDCNYEELPFPMVKDWVDIYSAYKMNEKKIDFTDLLENCDSVLDVDYLFIDECQDLSPLQWKVMSRAAENCKRVYIAGDDDQSIYGWAGAEIDYILNIKADKNEVLPKSYRLPEAIFKVSGQILKRIKQRQPKKYTHNGKKGIIEHVSGFDIVDYAKETDCLVLCRNRWQIKDVKLHLEEIGVPYSVFNKSSLDCKEVEAVLYWENFRKGRELSPAQYKVICKFSKKLKGILSARHVPKDFLDYKWFEIMDLMPNDMKNYIRRVVQSGHKINQMPKINLSTIHQSKGGEADTVVLLTDVSTTVWENIHKDDEHRVWYVATTRAKNKLVIVQEQGTRYYQL
jgi:superfamily I DNA/RNA helicase